MHDQDDMIDYLHPDGKPVKSDPKHSAGKPDQKELEQAVQEADGHSVYKPDSFLDGEDTDPSCWETGKDKE